MEQKTVWIINHYAQTPTQGGLSRHYYFAKSLIARGYKVRIFTASTVHNTTVNMIDSDYKPLFKEIEVDGLTYTYVKTDNYTGNGLSRMKNMLGFAWDIGKIWKAYGKENPDVIYTSSPDIFTAWSSGRLARKHKIPIIVEIRDLWPLSVVEYMNLSNKNPSIVYLYAREKKIYKSANALIFTMEGGKDYIRDKKWDKDIDLSKVFNINNGIDGALICSEDAETNMTTDGVFRVVFAGSIRKANDVGRLVDAAKYLKGTNVELHIYGDGNEKAALEKRKADEGIENVKFFARVPRSEIADICRNAQLNVINVKKTNVGKYGVSWNKLFDYMAAGRPLLSTLKVNYDLIENNNCGISLDDQSPENIAKAILSIAALPQAEYDAMCRNARKTAEKYDFEKLTDKLEEVIEFACRKP